jgi:hypothetical protein
MLDPEAQAEALHDAAVQMVGAKRAKRWIKTGKNTISTASNAAANAFPLLMLGLPPQIPEGLNPIQQIQTLFGLAGGYIAGIERTTKVPSVKELQGLQNVAAYLIKLVTGMRGDKGNEAAYKEFAHDLSQLNNEIKKLGVALASQMQKNQAQNGNGAEAAKVQSIVETTKAKIAAKQAETAQKLRSKELADRQKARHKDQSLVREEQRKDVRAVTDSARASLREPRKPLAE